MFLDAVNLSPLIIKSKIQLRFGTSICMLVLLGVWSRCLPGQAQPSRADVVAVRDHIYKGNTMMQRRDYAAAIAEYEQALDIDPTSTSAKENIVLTHNNWGIDFFHQKKYDEAKEQWNMALKLNPYDRNAKNNLNVLRIQLNKLGSTGTGGAGGGGGSAEPGKATGADAAKSGGSILPKGAQTAKEDNTPIPSAVIIGRPSATTINTQSTTTIQTAPPAPPSPSPAITPPAVPAPIVTTNSASGGSTQSGSSAVVVTHQAPTSADASKPTSSSSMSSSNIEDKLAALENKVYGRVSKDVPILQRLERLERDTSSRPSLGSINDRVQTLIKTYGL